MTRFFLSVWIGSVGAGVGVMAAVYAVNLVRELVRRRMEKRRVHVAPPRPPVPPPAPVWVGAFYIPCGRGWVAHQLEVEQLGAAHIALFHMADTRRLAWA